MCATTREFYVIIEQDEDGYYVGRGLLRKILRDADLTREELLELLSG